MKTIVTFGTEKIEIMTQNVNISKSLNAPPQINIEVRMWNESTASWMFDRFNEEDEIKLEIQVRDKKLVIKRALLFHFRPVIHGHGFFASAEISAESFVYKDGIIGMPDVWSVS